MLHADLEEKVHEAKHALDGATSENIIELCKHYLALLAEYRSELHKLLVTPGINLKSGSSPSREEVETIRKTVRVAIETTTQERNRSAALLRSFTAVSGYEAVDTLNRRKYKGHYDWALRSGGVTVLGSTVVHRMTVQEAVDTTSLLRREEHIAHGATLEGQK